MVRKLPVTDGEFFVPGKHICTRFLIFAPKMTIMDSAELILKYFPGLTAAQKEQLEALRDVYTLWNEQINVISRKDLDHFYERHVLHALAIAKAMPFKDGSKILDVGTGGGFPGIPLAILFPACDFHLVDSIGKKIKVVKEVAEALKLTNVEATHDRAENIRGQYDFVVSRAVTAMPAFLGWLKGKFRTEQQNELSNGVLYLKGGDLSEEMQEVRQQVKYYPISDFYEEAFFETKKVVYVRMTEAGGRKAKGGSRKS